MASSRSSRSSGTPAATADEEGAARELELRRGPWTVDEDLALVNYITDHGEGRWNSLAQAAEAAYTAAAIAGDVHALSGMGVTSSSSTDSFVTTTSESYDAVPMMKKWDTTTTTTPYDGEGIYSDVRAGEMLVNGGDCWVQETNQAAGMWCDQKAQVNNVGGQIEDPELSGWVQSFSEGVTENFWTLEDIWKMQ
ncbi:hypothetical protein EJB05_01049 [Eragrostis curvula]|uniref:Uncharacterized protein n=1 Tax=Eragrostis curvula TaxID=38414 RepID=A0A5J9WNM8_9POAL|nr:hypothetical protein EJB05_01049 [Eragrostis curvula]